jgi:hypothetical protein
MIELLIASEIGKRYSVLFKNISESTVEHMRLSHNYEDIAVET